MKNYRWENVEVDDWDQGETQPLKEAIESYKKILEIEPKNTQAWFNLGYSYNEIGDHEKAIESYKKVVEIDSKNTLAWNNMGNIYSKIENYKKAIESFKKVVEIDPKQIKTWHYIAHAYDKLGNHEKAKESFEKTILMDKFKFIRDDVFLCPRVNLITGKQKLILHKIDLTTNRIEFEDFIDCIHTAVTNISAENYEDYQNRIDVQEHFNKKILEIRSSEELTEIKLTPEEKFKALKSWVAGIAEAGVNAFRIQDEIDMNLDLFYPISHFLFRFMIKADSDFIPQYLMKIERECMFEGVRHESSFLANTIPILDIIWKNYKKNNAIGTADIEVIKTLIVMDNSDKLFKTNDNFLILLILAEPEYAKSIMIPEENCKVYDKIVELRLTESNFNDLIEERKTKIKSSAIEAIKKWEYDKYSNEYSSCFYLDNENHIKCNTCLYPKILCKRENSLNDFIIEKYRNEDLAGNWFCPKISDIKNTPETKLMVEALHILHETGELNKPIITRIDNIIYEKPRENRKIEIKRLSQDFLHNWENDEWIIKHSGTVFCRNVDYDSTIPDYYKVNEKYNFIFCPNIICDNEICSAHGFSYKSLCYIIYEMYAQEDENQVWIPLKISEVKGKPEVKLMIEALRMLHDTGELNPDIELRIHDIRYQ